MWLVEVRLRVLGIMDNRANILNCALQLFASKGYDGVGVQEIVDAAGVTKSTLYHYFGSKGGLLEALLADYFDPFLISLEEAAVYRRDLPLTLNLLASSYFQFAEEKRMYYRMILSMWFAPVESVAYEAVSRLNDKQQELLEGVFMQASRDYGYMKGRQRAYAATFLGMIHSYIGLALNGYVRLDDELVVRAVHQFMYGIFS